MSLSDALQETGVFPDAWVFPLGTLVSALMLYDISRRNERHAVSYRRIAVLVLLVGMVANLPLFSDLLAASACLVVGALFVVYGYRVQQLSLFAGGLPLFLAGVVHQFIELIRDFELANWASLAVLGAVSIVIASVLESQGGKLRLRLEAWRGRLHAWEK